MRSETEREKDRYRVSNADATMPIAKHNAQIQSEGNEFSDERKNDYKALCKTYPFQKIDLPINDVVRVKLRNFHFKMVSISKIMI